MPGHTTAALASYAELNARRRSRRRCTPAPATSGVQLAVHGPGDHLPVHRRGVRRAGRADPGPVPAHRHGRGARDARGRTTSRSSTGCCRWSPRTARPSIGWHEMLQADPAGVGGGAVLGTTDRRTPSSPRRPRRGNRIMHVAGDHGLPGHEVHAGDADRLRLGRPTSTSTTPTAGTRRLPDDGVPRVGRPRRRGVHCGRRRWRRFDQVEYMAFPRLPAAVAELGWSPVVHPRLAGLPPAPGGARSTTGGAGVNFYRSTQVPWDG